MEEIFFEIVDNLLRSPSLTISVLVVLGTAIFIANIGISFHVLGVGGVKVIAWIFLLAGISMIGVGILEPLIVPINMVAPSNLAPMLIGIYLGIVSRILQAEVHHRDLSDMLRRG